MSCDVALRAERAPRVVGDRTSGVMSSALMEAAMGCGTGDVVGAGVGGFGFRAVCKLGSAPYCSRTSTSLCRPCLAAI